MFCVCDFLQCKWIKTSSITDHCLWFKQHAGAGTAYIILFSRLQKQEKKKTENKKKNKKKK